MFVEFFMIYEPGAGCRIVDPETTSFPSLAYYKMSKFPEEDRGQRKIEKIL